MCASHTAQDMDPEVLGSNPTSSSSSRHSLWEALRALGSFYDVRCVMCDAVSTCCVPVAPQEGY